MQRLLLTICICIGSGVAPVAWSVSGDSSVDSRPAAAGDAPGVTELNLRQTCPPGFELSDKGNCRLVNMYQFYDSLQDRGLGGTRTSLPSHRDGFTPQQIDLGRYLFFDPLLSGDGTMSCASCHDPALGFSDGRARSIGAAGHAAKRSVPTLWNVAFLNRFFWDARAGSLEEQVEGPLYSAVEMGNTPQQLYRSLNESESYRRLFKRAFPAGQRGEISPGQALPARQRDEISLQQAYVALAAFQASLISLNSRYDRYAHGYHDALNKKEIEGMNVFRSFVARCAECHTPPLFTNQQVAVIGTPEPEGYPFDPGAEQVFQSPKMRGGFKVPTLRNIEKTAPYMHSGRFQTLRDAVAFYSKGRGHAVPAGENLHIHWHIWEPGLTDYEMDRVVDFLRTLTDEIFIPEIPDRVPSGLAPAIGVPVAPDSREVMAITAGENRGESS